MRKIKFRGIAIDIDDWYYGDLTSIEQQSYIVGTEMVAVNAKTVGQFTGLYDKNGKEIYEGDILQEIGSDKTVLVVYEAPQFCYADNSFGYKFLNLPEYYTVIGNIHDNPELLKGGVK